MIFKILLYCEFILNRLLRWKKNGKKNVEEIFTPIFTASLLVKAQNVPG